MRRATGSADFGSRLGRCRAVDIEDRESSALAREAERYGVADAGTRTGDDGNMTV